MRHMTFVLIAHNIRSAHNVGAVFRTCEGFGVDTLILSGYTPYPQIPNDPRLPHEAVKITARIHKTALGAEQLVNFEHVTDIHRWLDNYMGTVVALEQTPDSVPISSYKTSHDTALIIGEEVCGIEPVLLKRCKTAVEIPMKGHKESFNVSVACGIALYQLTT